MVVIQIKPSSELTSRCVTVTQLIKKKYPLSDWIVFGVIKSDQTVDSSCGADHYSHNQHIPCFRFS
jgi:hypothetical protein